MYKESSGMLFGTSEKKCVCEAAPGSHRGVNGERLSVCCHHLGDGGEKAETDP